MQLTRITIDLPSQMPVARLHELAREFNCGLFRRSDGTFAIRPSNPTKPPQTASDR